jgi:hypothetical protein
MFIARCRSLKNNERQSMAALGLVKADVWLAFCPHMELQYEAALTLFNDHPLFGKVGMRLMRFVSIDGDVHHEQGFVHRNKFVSTPDFVGVADRDHVRRAPNFNDPDVVPVPFQFHHVRKVTCWILGRGGRSRKATKDDYAACEAQCNGSSFLQICHLRLPIGNDEIISKMLF